MNVRELIEILEGYERSEGPETRIFAGQEHNGVWIMREVTMVGTDSLPSTSAENVVVLFEDGDRRW